MPLLQTQNIKLAYEIIDLYSYLDTLEAAKEILFYFGKLSASGRSILGEGMCHLK